MLNKKTRYIKVFGREVHLNREQQKAWDKMINDVRNHARNEKSCSQSNYHLCSGDCENCKWHTQGVLFSMDDPDFIENTSMQRDILTVPFLNPEEAIMLKDIISRVYDTAAKYRKNGDLILYKNLIECKSSHTIADELSMPQRTVSKYLNDLLLFLREHRSEFI